MAFTAPSRNRFYRVAFEAASAREGRGHRGGAVRWSQRVEIGGPYHFSSAWMSAGLRKRMGVRGIWARIAPSNRGGALTAIRARPREARFQISGRLTPPWATFGELPATSALNRTISKLAKPAQSCDTCAC